MFVLFWGGLHGDSVLFPLRCLFFFKFAFGAVYTGTPVFFSTPLLVLFLGGESVFSPLSMRCCFVLSLLGAWCALLVMFFVVFGRWGAGLSLPSVGFVNAV